MYRIRPNFLRRTIFVHCYFQTVRGNNFRGSRVSSIWHSKIRELNFLGLLGSTKTAKITCVENLDIYGTCNTILLVLYIDIAYELPVNLEILVVQKISYAFKTTKIKITKIFNTLSK